MHLSRRMRLIWHKLWLIPLVGATADVVASEAAKLGGVTVPIPWLFSAIGVAGMLGAAVARAHSVPLIPEGLETTDEALTRRSRILGERLGATPVRVFVSDLPKLRGKVDTYLDGHDLFVSERVAELPKAERDFVLARALAWRVRGVTSVSRERYYYVTWIGITFALVTVLWPLLRVTYGQAIWIGAVTNLSLVFADWLSKGPQQRLKDHTPETLALRATGNHSSAVEALRCLAESDAQKVRVDREASNLTKWWNTKGQKAVEATEWYQRELAKASETNPRSSRTLSGDSSIELPASETS